MCNKGILVVGIIIINQSASRQLRIPEGSPNKGATAMFNIEKSKEPSIERESRVTSNSNLAYMYNEFGGYHGLGILFS